jgi:vacuolar-type H+-ATPase subunit E/Vma4
MGTILGDPEALVAEVSRRAHQKAVQIAEDARRRSVAILEGATKESEAIRQAAALDAERQTAALLRRNAARAELESQRRFIEKREQPIERVWRAAEERLRSLMQAPGYAEILQRFAFRAAHELGEKELTLASDGVGRGLMTDALLERWSQESGIRFRPAAQTIAAWGGLIATSGRARLDFSFATRIESARAGLRERVFQLLNTEHT